MSNAASPGPSYRPPVPAKRRKNRRTLRGRIARNMHFLSLINLFLFCCVLMYLLTGVFRPISYSVSSYFAKSIADDLASPMALRYFGVSSLSELDPQDPEVDAWIRETIDKVTKYGQLPWAVEFTLEGDKLEGRPVQEDVVYVELTLNGARPYDNLPRMAKMEDPDVRKLIEYYKTESRHPIVDEATGAEIGSIMVGINPTIPLALTIGLGLAMLALLLAALLITKLIGKLLAVPLIAPITQLEQKVKAIAEGDFEATLDAKIELKRPLREIESLMDSTNRIMENMQRYAEQLQQQKATVEEQNDELEAQNDELVRSKARLQEAQALLTERERSVRNLLDNAKQGFLTFGPDLLVDDEYSRECERLYGGPIAGRSFPEMLAPFDEEQRLFVERLLRKLFDERDPGKRQVLLPLLPEETKLGATYVQIEYAMIADRKENGETTETCMAILTDITEKRHLQSRMEQERNTLQTVVKVVVDYNAYASLVRAFGEWCAMPFGADIREDGMKAALFDLFRVVHTFKGSFAQIGMTRLADRLHEVESIISGWSKRPVPPTAEAVIAGLEELRMPAWLEEEQAVLRGVLGDAFFEQDEVLLVDRAKLVELERMLMATLSPADCKLLLPELRKIRFKPFRELLASYPGYVEGLAERFDKMIRPFEIEGGDFPVDGETYLPLARSLVHVFRNAVDHGLESPDERAALGKEEYGSIRCAVALEGDAVRIDIRDDGRGIDADKLVRKAVEQGALDEETAASLAPEAALELVFLGELSSKDEVTEWSGRGVGLSSLRYEAERLGGSVTVASTPGAGTVFSVTLPYESLSDVPAVTPSALLLPIAETASAFFAEAAGLTFRANGDVRAETGGKMALMNFSTFMSVKGACNGLFVLTMDEATSSELTRRLAYGALTPEETSVYMEDTLAEAANIVLGNSLRRMEALEAYLSIDPPITVFTQGASMKAAESDMWSIELTGASGAVAIGFIKM
ncbi:ATP-binding protein [Paenibacillus sp.]|uniref:ATP-binding protein n=1 Tax=Paenibacillus sp. TaxID=58172 RepID=UPI002D539F4A|nr:ATP-binding protein [Paenibacillus sp.]HZG56996.1 ATP-binding protein [Paenibacillus sp.]